jgi:DNA helicase HerA-like ATPase
MELELIAIATTAGGAPVVFSRYERERHLYIVGKSGGGKSTFLYNLAMGDILSGEGVAVIDPHGDLALDILDASVNQPNVPNSSAFATRRIRRATSSSACWRTGRSALP